MQLDDIKKIIITDAKFKPKNQQDKFIRLVSEDKFQEAFLLACRYCQPSNNRLYRSIRTLIHYRTLLDISLDATDEMGNTPILLAALTRHTDLYDYLSDFGVSQHTPNKKGQTPVITLCGDESKFMKIIQLDIKLHPRYQQIMQQFQSGRIPAKEESIHGEAGNAGLDLIRLQFFIDVMTCYQELQLFIRTALGTNLTDYERNTFALLNKDAFKELLGVACISLSSISGWLRSEAKQCFEPKPFTFETFEQLAGLFKDFSNLTSTFPGAVPGDKLIEFISFVEEYRSMAMFVNSAQPAIFTELMQLIPLVRQLQDLARAKNATLTASTTVAAGSSASASVAVTTTTTTTTTAAPVTPATTLNETKLNLATCRLVSIRAIVSYIQAMHSIAELGILTFPIDRIKRLDRREERVQLFSQRQLLNSSINSQKDQEAALYRLQVIGELFVVRRFPHDFIPEDIDPQVFIIIRDILAHQDELDNYHKVAQLLTEDARVQRVYEDLNELHGRIVDIMVHKEKTLHPHHGIIEDLLSNVLRREAARKLKVTPPVTLPKRRITEVEETQFINGLEAGVDKETKTRMRAFFAGKEGEYEGKKWLKLLKKDDGQMACKAIWDKAIGKTTEAQRMEVRRKRQEDSERRKQERMAKLTGLLEIRALATQWVAKDTTPRDPRVIPANYLNPMARITIAINRLVTIQNYLLDSGYFVAGANCKTFAEWEQYHAALQTDGLLKRFETDPKLKDAILYNAGQLLQFLERIREFPEARHSRLLKDDYEPIRHLRNYIIHGNPINDMAHSLSSINSEENQRRDKHIMENLITVIADLSTDLNAIKAEMTANGVPAASVAIQPVVALATSTVAAVVTPIIASVSAPAFFPAPVGTPMPGVFPTPSGIPASGTVSLVGSGQSLFATNTTVDDKSTPVSPSPRAG